MKNKRPSTFSSERKAEVLAAAAVPGCVISDLAKSYGVGRGSIYAWIRQQKKTAANTFVPRFLEVAVREQIESKEPGCPIELTESPALSKASLKFDNFSLVIEGKIASTKLISILKILED